MQQVKSILSQLQSDGIHLSVAELLRYQQLTRLIDLSPRRTLQARLSGQYLSRDKGRGMEFDEARHYLPGDDIRAIDWRVTARTGKTHTKVYREERERPVFLCCDLTSSMQFGTQLMLKSVQAAHLASLLSWSAVARGDKIGALLFDDVSHRECKPMSRKRAVLSVCHELISMQQHALQQATSNSLHINALEQASLRLRRVVKPGSLIYLISDFSKLSELAQSHLISVARHCEIHAVHIYDPIELSLPPIKSKQTVKVTDGEQEQTWMLGDAKINEQYHSWRTLENERLKNFFKKSKILFHSVSSGTALDKQLLQFSMRTA
ncbi:DUF58 domain-containing protein [Alteromonas sp. ASW11-130]|uniref:DUF58 domain-containing protein n=1 Tax=Alteromonas sp. ASW11-130 TaxID=3015775 RepID=UPI0022428A2A|nr:DUF58 domain-containing protein [Alteromonas sp. ASW11-130]MCW8093048.1 DUF58 domain-containing protein [Alteromonas sp. ASW11-130]